MKLIQVTSKPILCALVLAGLGALSQPAQAAVYDLRAASTMLTMADGTQIPMWGFGLTTDLTVSIPGPVLEVPPGDDTLIINLTNELPVPVSIVIPAVPAPLIPVWDDGSSGPRTSLQQRAVSFTHVAQPGETVAYQWNNVQPGTYLYHSGSHPAVQVPMGLYGAVRHDAAAGETYGIAYDNDLVLLYGEIDPTLNGAVADGTYGTPSYPTTLAYRPRYFLINGREASSPVAFSQNTNERLLLRLVNAGLRTIVPTLTSGSMRLLAEDGQAAPFVRESYSMLLSAGKTRDALLVLTEPGSTVLFDRTGAARLARVSATAASGAPFAAADVYAATEDMALDTAAAGLAGVLANDSGSGLSAVLSSSTSVGTLVFASDGSFVYTPAPNFNGVDTFRYQATDSSLTSNVATVSINVGAASDAPLANDDAYQAVEGTTLSVEAPGLLANDQDIDGDALIVQSFSAPDGSSLIVEADGSFQYTPDPGTTTFSFSYQVSDGSAISDAATVTITVTQPVNSAPLSADDFATTVRNTAVVINVIGNDSDADGSIDPSSVTVTNQPTRGGTATSLGDGTVRYQPRANFRGTETFTYVVSDNAGLASAPATVRVNVTP